MFFGHLSLPDYEVGNSAMPPYKVYAKKEDDYDTHNSKFNLLSLEQRQFLLDRYF